MGKSFQMFVVMLIVTSNFLFFLNCAPSSNLENISSGQQQTYVGGNDTYEFTHGDDVSGQLGDDGSPAGLTSLAVKAQQSRAMIAVQERDEWSFLIDKSEITPVVRAKDEQYEVTQLKNFRWGASWKIVKIVNSRRQEVGEFSLYTKSARLIVSVKLFTDEQLSYGVYLSGTNINLLDTNMTSIKNGVTQSFFPYDWNKVHKAGNFVKPELVVPGIKLDDVVVSHSSNQLYQITLQKTSRGSQALFYKYAEYNSDNRDRATSKIRFAAGEVSEFQIESARSVASLMIKRNGRPKAISGIMTQMPVKQWGSENEVSYLTDREYEKIAKKLASGGVKHVVLRLNSPKRHISEIFRQNGVIPHYYQFLGVSRWRKVDGRECYSLMLNDQAVCVEEGLLRDSKNRVVTCAVNTAWGLMDLRKTRYERMLIETSVEAIRNGYEGIFFDGTGISPGDDGLVGGDAPGSTESWFKARADLFKKVMDAVEEVNSNAIVGSITNIGGGFSDFQNYGDYVGDEVASWVEPLPEDPSKRKVNLPESAIEDMSGRAKFYSVNYYINAKGSDVAQLKSFYSKLRTKVKLPINIHLDIGDFYRDYYPQWSKAISDTAKGVRSESP